MASHNRIQCLHYAWAGIQAEGVEGKQEEEKKKKRNMDTELLQSDGLSISHLLLKSGWDDWRHASSVWEEQAAEVTSRVVHDSQAGG